MPDFKGAENLRLILIFLVPGLIILFVRSKFIISRKISSLENVLTYLVFSLVYYSIIIPVFDGLMRIQEPWWLKELVWVGLSLVGPAAFGLILGAAAQKEWGDWAANRLGLATVHPIPSAWD